MLFPFSDLRSEALMKNPPVGLGLRLGGTGLVITTWKGTCSLPAPATFIFLPVFDQTILCDSILSSGRTFCSAGTAHTDSVSAEAALALSVLAPVFCCANEWA